MHDHSQILAITKKYKHTHYNNNNDVRKYNYSMKQFSNYNNIQTWTSRSSFTHYQPGFFKLIYDLFTK